MILLPSCQAATAAMAARQFVDLLGMSKKSVAFQQVYKRTRLMSCLGIHVCFLYLTCIQTQFFGNWTEEQAPTPDGVAERNVTGNMAALRKAQHERRHLADERWRCWKIQVMQTVAPAVMPQDVGPPRRTCTWNEKGNIIPVSFTRKKVIAHFELRELKTGENIDR